EGICDPSYRYPIRITNGNLGNAGTASVSISGKVGKNGAVVVNVSAGDKTATGTGRLAATSGSGSWSGGNGACFGTWQAERRGQAFSVGRAAPANAPVVPRVDPG